MHIKILVRSSSWAQVTLRRLGYDLLAGWLYGENLCCHIDPFTQSLTSGYLDAVRLVRLSTTLYVSPPFPPKSVCWPHCTVSNSKAFSHLHFPLSLTSVCRHRCKDMTSSKTRHALLTWLAMCGSSWDYGFSHFWTSLLASDTVSTTAPCVA